MLQQNGIFIEHNNTTISCNTSITMELNAQWNGSITHTQELTVYWKTLPKFYFMQILCLLIWISAATMSYTNEISSKWDQSKHTDNPQSSTKVVLTLTKFSFLQKMDENCIGFAIKFLACMGIDRWWEDGPSNGGEELRSEGWQETY